MNKMALYGFALYGLIQTNANAFNFSYVEVNSNRLENVGCYILSKSQQPFFAMTAIFAANINGASPNEPEIYLNDQVSETLNSSQVKNLQKKGIKVLVTLLGNHQNAGWSCMTDEKAAKKFANQVVEFVNQYQLDGVDIDDEYSTCQPNETSLIMIAQAIKENPAFSGKILSKALFSDFDYFTAKYNGHKLSEYLDYGWEMSYSGSDFQNRLSPYLEAGMKKSQLMIGGSSTQADPNPTEIGKFSRINKTAGVMVYNITTDTAAYLSDVQKGLKNNKATITVVPHCLN